MRPARFDFAAMGSSLGDGPRAVTGNAFSEPAETISPAAFDDEHGVVPAKIIGFYFLCRASKAQSSHRRYPPVPFRRSLIGMSLLGTQALLSWWRFVADLSPRLIEWNGDTFGMIRFPCALELRQSGWPRTRSARHHFLARVSLENREVRHRSKLPQKPPGETLGDSAFLQQAPQRTVPISVEKQQSRAITYLALCRAPLPRESRHQMLSDAAAVRWASAQIPKSPEAMRLATRAGQQVVSSRHSHDSTGEGHDEGLGRRRSLRGPGGDRLHGGEGVLHAVAELLAQERAMVGAFSRDRLLVRGR